MRAKDKAAIATTKLTTSRITSHCNPRPCAVAMIHAARAGVRIIDAASLNWRRPLARPKCLSTTSVDVMAEMAGKVRVEKIELTAISA
ncbi:MAG: hypothetical protein QOJ65_737 [Fimbriimonadaceae bacterium]|nr:hypothetical protein [Fimbriimonadaceae bacterium]